MNYFYPFFTIFLFFIPLCLSYSAQKKYSLQIDLTYFRLVCLFFAAWIFYAFLPYIITDTRWLTYFHHLKYPAISFIAVSLFFHVYAVIRHKTPTVKLLLALSFIPLLTLLFAIIEPYYSFLYINVASSNSGDIQIIYAPWFFIHVFYTYVLLVFTVFMILKPIYLLPENARMPLQLLLVSVIFLLFVNFIYILDVFPFNYDITLPAAGISLILFYYSLPVTRSANILITSREKIYNNLRNMIFVLDLEGKIIDFNEQARNHFKTIIALPYEGLHFDEFVRRWFWTRNGRMSPYQKNIYITEKDGKESHYLLYGKNVKENSKNIGYFIEMLEISEVYDVFRLLEESAFYDSLTGLHNRNSYIIKINDWKTEEVLPLAIIISDVNKLKEVNDSYGHLVGDQLLKNVAAIIKDSVPKRSYIARIGGDEFIVLIPNSSQEEIETVYNIINTNLSQHTHPVYGRFSLALGGVLREDTSLPIDEMIEKADQAMYRDKFDRRKK